MYNVSVEHALNRSEVVANDIETFKEAASIATEEAFAYLPKTPLVQVWQIAAISGHSTCILHVQSGEGIMSNSSRCH